MQSRNDFANLVSVLMLEKNGLDLYIQIVSKLKSYYKNCEGPTIQKVT